MNKRTLFAAIGLAIAATACTTTSPSSSADASAQSKRAKIDTEVSSAMSKLYAQDPGSRELVAKARGVLVFPGIVSAGLIVGGSYGQGELLVRGRNEGYYSTTAGSVGLLAGAESKAVYILFMTDAALDKFRSSNGWVAGADASVSVIKAGASASVDTNTVQQPVVGYVLTNAGLMANLAIDGTKISKIEI